MTQFQTDFPYYGFINAELVEWWLSEEGHLTVWAMGEGPHIYIRKDKWQYKRFLFGSGNIIFKLPFKGHDYTFKLGLTSMREHKANEADFFAERNGPFNLSSRHFSSIFKGVEVIAPDGVWPCMPRN